MGPPKKPPVKRMPRFRTVHTHGTLRREVAADGDLSVLQLFENWKTVHPVPSHEPFGSPRFTAPRGQPKACRLPVLPTPRGVGRVAHGNNMLPLSARAPNNS